MTINWQDLEHSYGKDLTDKIKDRLLSGRSREIDPDIIASEIRGIEKQKIISILQTLVNSNILERVEVSICPACSYLLNEDDLSNGICSSCSIIFEETGDKPFTRYKYYTFSKTRRSVPWVITVHGMNARGEWQEDFSWRIAHKFKYHVPVLIHKFGVLRYRALFHLTQKYQAKLLAIKIRTAVAHAVENGISEPPDILAHSFGSLVLSSLLDIEEYQDIKFGRVIIAGAIIKPNYNWSKFVINGRIEAVFKVALR